MTEDDHRPDPDALLASLPAARGRLKLFFGAAPGVGKTYAMLAEAQEKRAAGLDVVVGWVDTHGRAETMAMLAGLEQLPRLKREHRERELDAFDLDAALARHPAVLVVDELPHSNAPGCRHPKRWQDVEELLSAGIDVYSAMNVQHLDSLNDVVSRVTGVAVSETVPDHVFDQADEVRLVDLPPDDLLQRLAAGKVYLPEVAQRAAANFFRKGNLIALRELALRRLADRVDSQMRAQRAIQGRMPVSGSNFGLLLLLQQAGNEDAIRQCARLARALESPWHAIWLDSGQLHGEARSEVQAALKLAAEQGAITLVQSGRDNARLLADYARRHNLSMLALAGRQHPARLLQALARLAPELHLLQLAASPPPDKTPRGWRFELPAHGWWQTVLLCVGVTALAEPLRTVLEPTNQVMFYLLAVLWSAVRYGRAPAALAAVLSVGLFDFFLVPPYFNFAVSDVQYLITFAVMLIVGLVAGQLVARQRQSADMAQQREAHTRTLFEMARELGQALIEEQVGEVTARYLHSGLGARIGLWRPLGEDDNLQPQQPGLPEADSAIVRWCFDHGEPAGQGTATLPTSPLLYLPLKAPMRTRGVLVLALPQPGELADFGTRRLCEAVAALAAQTLERLHYIDVAQQTLLNMEAERMRHSLLAALSHDLRTPLTGLTGNAETLARKLQRAGSPFTADVLLLQQQGQRIARLVTNLLEMAQLQAGGITLKKDWLPVEEMVGGAIAALGGALDEHVLRTDIDPDCPLIHGDPVLLERLLVNLLENAAKYSRAGSEIRISGTAENGRIVLRVADQGVGLPAGDTGWLFRAFSRGDSESNVSGVGLGLAICRTIADAHEASLSAENLPQGGACFTLALPLVAQPALDFPPEN
ncbi:DUF4118 domain-containing protein [Vogesella sp. LIG4]|uniref:DUF4118 domain-containing protein n=1 Tax=Vogesella sp. LIG4 TaxID=1192162 RepID=UPI0008201CEB|nr:DUF4118 domain-containing protein [Vogesella sp. LIG4]SCK18748.1 two-component system, OmpR family, sensor histidine kinase KdpD [Vogesella sp. LIG4]